MREPFEPTEPTDEKRPGNDRKHGQQHGQQVRTANPVACFSEERRIAIAKSLGYFRMRARSSQMTPLLDWEVEDLCDTLDSMEDFVLRIWPLIKALAEQPYLEPET